MIIGIIILCLPQVFTKKDLNSKENLSTKRTMQIVGIAAIVTSVIIFLVKGLSGK